MMHNLIQTRKGKDTIVMTDALPKVNDRMKQLRSSQRRGIKGDKVTYRVSPVEDATPKYRKKPSKSWKGYN